MACIKRSAVLVLLLVFTMAITTSAAPDDILNSLKNADPAVRLKALQRLDEVAAGQITSQLVDLLADSDYNVSQTASQLLVQIGQPAVSELDKGLIKFAGLQTLTVRQSITRVLGQIDTPQSVAVLIRALDDSSPQIKRSAAQALEQIGSNAIDSSVRLAEIVLNTNEDAQARAAAVQALGSTGYNDDIAVLAIAIARVERQFQVVWAAQGAMNKLNIDTRSFVVALAKMIDDVEYGYLAKDALAHIINTNADGLEVLEFIIADSDRDSELALVAQFGVVYSGLNDDKKTQMVPIIESALLDPDPGVRLATVTGFSKTDHGIVSLVPTLSQLALDNEQPLAIRQAALAAWEWVVNNDYNLDDQVVELAVDPQTDNELRAVAVRMIGLLTKASSPEANIILANLDMFDTQQRWQLSGYLVKAAQSDPEVITTIMTLLIDSSDAELQLFAVRLLSATGPQAKVACPVLMDLVKTTTDEYLKLASIRALAQVGAGSVELNSFFTNLKTSESVDITRIAQQYLGEYEYWETPAKIPAFPSAQGYGAWSVGGRGGEIVVVTNLNDRGPGSFREAVETKQGPRTVVFDVSGTIYLDSPITIHNPYLTIAGQTAPGGGITLANYTLNISADDVIVRHIRVRLGDRYRQESDAVTISGANNVIVDHISSSWGMDETLSISGSGNVTVQWSLITESLKDSFHSKGDHGYGSLLRGERGSKYSMLNNLWAHHMGRMPRPGNYLSYREDPIGAQMDFRNNVFYNWGGNNSGANNDSDSITKYNFINNYYIRGANSTGSMAFRENSEQAAAYFAGNYMNGQEPANPWSLVDIRISKPDYKQSKPYSAGRIIDTVSAPEAYERVLTQAGAFPRDQIDERVIQSVISKTGRQIDTQADVGGWINVTVYPRAQDSNGDNIPDWWYIKHGFDPAIGLAIHDDLNNDGYTNFEDYINGTDPEVYVNYTNL